MVYWVFTVTKHSVDGNTVSAKEVIQQRMDDKFWGLYERRKWQRLTQHQ